MRPEEVLVKRVYMAIAVLCVSALAGSKDGRKVDGPGWATKPPTSSKGVYGVGVAQGTKLPEVMAQADSAACREVAGLLPGKVAAWASEEDGLGKGEFAGIEAGTVAATVACQIQKREDRQDVDGSYRAYALGYLGRKEAVAALKAAQAGKFQGDAASSQDELDRALKGNPPAAQE